MAEEKTSVSTTKSEQGYKLKVIGPANKYSGSQVLRFKHDDGRKEDLTMVQGQTLKVGGKESDLSAKEAERLQHSSTWVFEKQ